MLATAVAPALAAPTLNGFDLDGSTIPARRIVRGGPPRDAIPALENPRTIDAPRADWPDEARVVGVLEGGEARAYPLSILRWHELVNDTLGGRPILVSYCPLCGTALVFDRRVDGEIRRFGVSGLLYQSDLLMFDRETESLWSQVSADAVTGASAGTRLELVRSRLLSWGSWKRAHPESTILTRETGYSRRYGRDPYPDYERSPELVFPVEPRDNRYHPKHPTLGLRLPGRGARAYPRDEVERAGGRVSERFEGHDVTITWDPKDGAFEVTAPDPIEVIEGYWFAWIAFHPSTSVFVAAPPP